MRRDQQGSVGSKDTRLQKRDNRVLDESTSKEESLKKSKMEIKAIYEHGDKSVEIDESEESQKQVMMTSL